MTTSLFLVSHLHPGVLFLLRCFPCFDVLLREVILHNIFRQFIKRLTKLLKSLAKRLNWLLVIVFLLLILISLELLLSLVSDKSLGWLALVIVIVKNGRLLHFILSAILELVLVAVIVVVVVTRLAHEAPEILGRIQRVLKVSAWWLPRGRTEVHLLNILVKWVQPTSSTLTQVFQL